jgi:hypothetical protein
MTVARTVADVLTEHTVFEVECIDRMYLNVYQPKLQYAAGLVGYVQRQLGLPIASTAPLARITDRFTRAVHRFAETEGIEWVDFARGQRKDDVMLERLQHFTAAEGVVFIGRAQEKTTVFRTEKRRHPSGVAYPWIVKTTGVINQFYFYCLDTDFGPFFLKFCSYFPYNGKLCLLTELPGGGPLATGRMRVRVVMVPTCDRKHRTGTGFERIGGSAAGLSAGQWGSVRALSTA